MIATDVWLTTTEFDLAWQAHGLGRMPYPLDVPRAGGAPPVVPDPGLGALLRVLAEATTSVDAACHIGRPLRALAAENGHTGVLAVLVPDGQGTDTVRLTEIRPTALVGSIVELVPFVPAGTGSPLSAPVAGDGGSHGPDGIELADRMAQRIAGGQFGVTVRGRDGRPRRAPTLVSWFDTRAGRYLVVREGGWLSLAPADNHRIAHRLEEVLTGS